MRDQRMVWGVFFIFTTVLKIKSACQYHPLIIYYLFNTATSFIPSLFHHLASIQINNNGERWQILI